MDLNLAALFYIGILVPTIITITVFVGFLLCLYKRNIRRKQGTGMTRRALPATPPHLSQRKTRNFDKFDKCSQHSADSAIDMGETDTSLEEKLGGAGVLLDSRKLEENSHSYQNKGMQLTTEVEIHSGGTLRKGFYPSKEKLDEEIHSQVKIYESMCDVQRIALQIHQKEEIVRESEKHLVAAAAQKQFSKLQQSDKTATRYTSTSKLIAGASPATTNNQLDKLASNYAAYSTSWYDSTDSATEANNHNLEIYRTQRLGSKPSWKPNIADSCSSNTDNYSSVESSRV